MEEMIDDGSLAFLQIPRSEKDASFNCPVITLTELLNKTFWVVDFVEKVETKYSKKKGSEGLTLVHIKFNKEDPMSESKKFFTGSVKILYILQLIKERNAFPRRVTMRKDGNTFYFE